MKAYSPSEQIVKQLSGLPDSPGCYIFKDDLGDILYIGKALSLRSRVRSYWTDISWRDRPKLAVMMPKVSLIETILTNSEKRGFAIRSESDSPKIASLQCLAQRRQTLSVACHHIRCRLSKACDVSRSGALQKR